MEAPFVPFCSQRCKDVDLGRWLRGDYRIPADQPSNEAPDAAPDELQDGPEDANERS